MKGVKFKLTDMLDMAPIEMKAPTLPRVGDTIHLANEEGVVFLVECKFQHSVTGGYSFKEYVVIVEWVA